MQGNALKISRLNRCLRMAKNQAETNHIKCKKCFLHTTNTTIIELDLLKCINLNLVLNVSQNEETIRQNHSTRASSVFRWSQA